eukprot:CAMPEP_0171132688 /NCGR_PEP_ID=MMETSP0766_2-20121228/125008_1 /TAXON_ID=439317 /ORGANISM="Gambierdiscus australes, Strain CAWD 149" /LENGTH=253 /DNA_ID=CAMNT_0011596039 /DNA_START=57 /DNA_END=815 /DNA_ORIENTATION=+
MSTLSLPYQAGNPEPGSPFEHPSRAGTVSRVDARADSQLAVDTELSAELMATDQAAAPRRLAFLPESCRAANPEPLEPREASEVSTCDPDLALDTRLTVELMTSGREKELLSRASGMLRPTTPEPLSPVEPCKAGIHGHFCDIRTSLLEALSMRDQRIGMLKQSIREARRNIAKADEASKYLQHAVREQRQAAEQLTAEVERCAQLMAAADGQGRASEALRSDPKKQLCESMASTACTISDLNGVARAAALQP